jgi:hypothetical protein
MSTESVFAKFVQEKKSQTPTEPINFDEQKGIWLGKLRELYEHVSSWLKPYPEIKIDEKTKQISEEALGTYQAPTLLLSIGSDLIQLDPIATFLFGARGRVDITGPKGVSRLLLVPKNAVGVTMQIRGVNEPKKDIKRIPPVSEWVWKLTSPPPTVQYVELNKKVFFDIIISLANG